MAVIAIFFILKGQGFLGAVHVSNPNCIWNEPDDLAGAVGGWKFNGYNSTTTTGTFFNTPYVQISWVDAKMTGLIVPSCAEAIGDAIGQNFLMNAELTTTIENEKRIVYVKSLEESSPLEGWAWCTENDGAVIFTESNQLKDKYLSSFSTCGPILPVCQWSETTCLMIGERICIMNPTIINGTTICEMGFTYNSQNLMCELTPPIGQPCPEMTQNEIIICGYGSVFNPITGYCEINLAPGASCFDFGKPIGGLCPNGGIFNKDLGYCEIC